MGTYTGLSRLRSFQNQESQGSLTREQRELASADDRRPQSDNLKVISGVSIQPFEGLTSAAQVKETGGDWCDMPKVGGWGGVAGCADLQESLAGLICRAKGGE